ncbi:3-isopropylmalate dehydratase small subunit [Candidatus Tremblaya phenacola]|uniref:3-isopropylmalate dehydratase n=1 Tax=Candidatus Tremblayella phenacoccinincola TaxID=1010676 RepID=A0A2G0V7B6_9PROT|nr:3-isopropylmalate dehydratase small subunit [Candidatus Tremblaya phenacola]PHN16358.1 3-isopropylmalate dehydratase small subunit 1 [Candidatus Tremblaya phenacola]
MDKSILHRGVIINIEKDNINTDVIIPKQFLKETSKRRLGSYLFSEWREPTYQFNSEPFPLVLRTSNKVSVLLVRKNFGCGSSREHAPWSIKQYGLNILIGLSFADIFYVNAIKNGILPLTLKEPDVTYIAQLLVKVSRLQITVNLMDRKVVSSTYKDWSFCVPSFYRLALLRGMSEAELVLKHIKDIISFDRSNE